MDERQAIPVSLLTEDEIQKLKKIELLRAVLELKNELEETELARGNLYEQNEALRSELVRARKDHKENSAAYLDNIVNLNKELSAVASKVHMFSSDVEDLVRRIAASQGLVNSVAFVAEDEKLGVMLGRLLEKVSAFQVSGVTIEENLDEAEEVHTWSSDSPVLEKA